MKRKSTRMMVNKSNLIFLAIALCSFVLFQNNAKGQAWGKVKAFGENYNEKINDIARDSSGNIYIIGTFDGSFDIGAQSYFSNGGFDAFIAKLDTGFNVLWVNQIESDGANPVSDVIVDSQQNVYVMGGYRDRTTFHGISSTYGVAPATGQDLFYAKYDNQGHIDTIGEKSYSFIVIPGDLTLGANNQIFGCASLVSSQSSAGIFFKTFLNNHNPWDYRLSNDFVQAHSIHAKDGRLYVGGLFDDYIKFSPQDSVYSHGFVDGYVGIFDYQGNFKSFKTYGSDPSGGFSSINKIKSDSNFLYILGSFKSQVMLNPANTLFSNDTNATVFFTKNKITSDSFSLSWSKKFEGTQTLWVTDFSIGEEDNIHIAGNYNGAYEYKPGYFLDSISIYDQKNMFYQKLNEQGDHQLILNSEGDDPETVTGVIVNSNRPVLAGSFFKEGKWGDTLINSYSNSKDIFIATTKNRAFYSEYSFFSICQGNTRLIDYVLKGEFNPGNKVIAQISHPTHLNKPIQVGEKITDSSGTIRIIIPDSLPADVDYKIQLKTTNPQITDEEVEFEIKQDPNVSQIMGPDNPPMGRKVTYSIKKDPGNNYYWIAEDGEFTLYGVGEDVEIIWEKTGKVTLTVVEDNQECHDTLTRTINVRKGINIGDYSFSGICPGEELSLDYFSFGSFGQNNEFIAQLSNTSGSFSNPINIGDIKKDTSGKINVTIPQNVPAAAGYKIRIVSTQPRVISDTGASFTIHEKPYDLSILGPSKVNPDQSYAYKVKDTQGAAYNWEIKNGSQLRFFSDSITVRWDFTDSGQAMVWNRTREGCVGDSTIQKIDIRKSVRIDYPAANVCPGATLNINYEVNEKFHSNNSFKAEISGPDGNFNDPLVIGELQAQTDSSISITFPDTLSAGSGYKIRMKSTSPVELSEAGPQIQVYNGGQISSITGQKDVEPNKIYPYSVKQVSGSEYHWSAINGTKVAGGTSNLVEIQWKETSAGKVKVYEETKNGCKGDTLTKSINIQSDNADGIADRNNSVKLELFPNPAGDFVKLQFQLDKRTDLTIELQDAVGKQLYRSRKGEHKGDYSTRLDLGSYKPGVYFLQIITEDQRVTKKLILK